MTEGEDKRAVPGYPGSIGPDLHTGGDEELAGVVPPYEGRVTSSEQTSYGDHPYEVNEQPYAGRDISETEKAGVPSTDTSGTSPLGVGESHTPQGNERALDESEEQRRQDREEPGVDPGTPTDSSMPNLRPGDQAG
ncbi:MAG: hypothetical protein GEV09_04940 [Pseudonocardiaceae bacterium]|nr:hypothetical protein [Pseudonocardiaceae bacterium]